MILKKGFLIITLLSSLFNACQRPSQESIYSQPDPSYYNPNYDFNPIFGTRRKLAQYEIERTYMMVAAGDFSGTLLNPANYPEDTEADVFYRPEPSSEVTEPVDYSDEEIAFAGFDSTLGDFISTLAEGQLSEADLDELMSLLDSNDDIVNSYDQEYLETILYHDFFNGAYYGFNNSHRIETKTMTRYDNHIVNGAGTGIIYYQDGYDHSYTLDEQTRATGFKIYEMRDETFPQGSTSAEDYKRTSDRVEGNFKQALQVAGGGRTIRFINDRIDEFTPFMNPSLVTYNANYSYELTAVKASESVSLMLECHIGEHIDGDGEPVYEMELTYEAVIENGIVGRAHMSQTYWKNL